VSRWVRTETVLWRRVPGAVLLLGVNTRDPIAVSGPGADLWELLGEEIAESTVCAALGSVYDAEETTVAADVRQVLEELEERGLVERAH